MGNTILKYILSLAIFSLLGIILLDNVVLPNYIKLGKAFGYQTYQIFSWNDFEINIKNFLNSGYFTIDILNPLYITKESVIG